MEYLDEFPLQSRFPVYVKTLCGDLYVVEVFPEERIYDLKFLLNEENPDWTLKAIHLYPQSNNGETTNGEAKNDEWVDECGYNLLIDAKLFGVELVVMDDDIFEYHRQHYMDRFLSEEEWDEYTERAKQCLSIYGVTLYAGDIIVIHHDDYSPRKWRYTDIWFRLICSDTENSYRQIIVESEQFPMENWKFYTEENTTRIIDLFHLIRYWCHDEKKYKLCTNEMLQASYEQNRPIDIIPIEKR